MDKMTPRRPNRLLPVLIICFATALGLRAEPDTDSPTALTAKKPKYPTTPAATRNPALLGFGMLAIGGVAAYFLFFRGGKGEDSQ
jgi:hypothetical protein